jgi:hypothetical protein
MSMSSEVQAQRPSRAPVAETDKVVVRNLNFYYGQTHALKSVNLNLYKGSGDGVHWPFGLRQVDAPARAQPDV